MSMLSSFVSHAVDLKTGNLTSEIVEGILSKGVSIGAEEIKRVTTIPSAECAILAGKFGIHDVAGVAEFTKAVQEVGNVFGDIVTKALEAKAKSL